MQGADDKWEGTMNQVIRVLSLLIILNFGVSSVFQTTPAAATEATAQAQQYLQQPLPLGRAAPEQQANTVCRVISFEEAELVGGFVNDTYMLSVSGEKPYLNMVVELWPYIYVRQPDYWSIEVVGCLQGIGLPTFGPYTADLWVTNFMGAKGVEVIGSNKKMELDRPK